jgi:hypothetical protein
MLELIGVFDLPLHSLILPLWNIPVKEYAVAFLRMIDTRCPTRRYRDK